MSLSKKKRNSFNFSTLCYVQKDGRTLMMHRVKKANDVHESKWNGLGGKFLPGETPEECVIREVEEESGLRIKDPVLKGVMMFPEFTPGEDWLVFLFTADRFEGCLTDSTEGNLEWISDAEVPRLNLWEGDRLFLSWMDRARFFSAKFFYQDQRLVEHQVKFYE